MSEQEYREFWIQINADSLPLNKPYKRYVSMNLFGGTPKGDEDWPKAEVVHVIEHSAYQAAQDKIQQL